MSLNEHDHPINDEQLILSFLSGKSQSFDHLIKKYSAKLFIVILQVVKDKDTSEDILQEVVIKILYELKLGKYKDEGKFFAWASRIARNMAIDHYRKQKKNILIFENSSSTPIENHPQTNCTSESMVIKRENQQIIRALIEKLPPTQKEVIILRHYNELTFNEIATKTNVSINTAIGRMRYALLNLRKLIENKT